MSVKLSDNYSGVCHSGIALKKEFSCRKRLNDVLNGIINGRLYKKWINDVSFAETIRKRLELKYEEPQLQSTLQDLKLAFFTLGFGYVVTFFTFLVEVLIPMRFDIFHP
ncbi:hypothetical protein TNIN_372171 [Trichonephila inaurata madagascariensis]|uniref:Uncharacterized protein n=1 Tax=Trichonephila inaurata madagascariensis TaxID=2747483 RepID=A0A8X7C651_9ARAC|nr:hypothetical protein TNIN_372171 [Trichonephila inaurata madagascariensis]